MKIQSIIIILTTMVLESLQQGFFGNPFSSGPLIKPVLGHGIDPVLDHGINPVLDHGIDPVLDHGIKPVLDHGIDPVLGHGDLVLGQSSEFMAWVLLNKKDSWTIGRNFDKAISLGFLKVLGGSVKPRPRDRKHKFDTQTETKPEAFQLPLNFDAREKWPQCPSISKISDQGSCGSCWAIAPVDVMTDRTCIHSQGRVKFRYSTEDLMSCCTSCGDGCDGGDPYVAYEYWISDGIVSGGHHNSALGCVQYSIPPCEHRTTVESTVLCDSANITTPECRRTCEGTYPLPYQSDLRRGAMAYNITTVEDAMYELATKGPINAVMLVYQDFFAYKAGVYQITPGTLSLGKHAIRVIGYGVENDVPYWLCANSWNGDWGDKGIFKILRGKNECGIEGELIAGIPRRNRN